MSKHPRIPDVVPEAQIDRLARHNRLTGRNYPGNTKAIADLCDNRTVRLSPHPPFRLADPIDWDADPFGQVNWCAQFHMLRWLELYHYRLEGADPQARESLEHVISSWAERAFSRRPPRYAWHNMTVAVRTLMLLRSLERVSEEYKPRLARIVWAHGLNLAEPNNVTFANHGTWQHQALFVLGEVFREEEWVDLALRRLASAFRQAFDADGCNEENASYYHLYNYQLWKKISTRLPADSGLTREISRTLAKTAQLIVAQTRPDGFLEEIGDTGPCSSIRSLAGIGEADWVLSGGRKGTKPPRTTTLLATGTVVGRSGWGEGDRKLANEFFYSLRFGLPTKHGHNDAAALTVHGQGVPLLVDAGKYAYVKNSWSRYFTSRAAHNTLWIPGKKETGIPYTLKHFHTNCDIDDVSVRGKPYFGVSHERRVVYLRPVDGIFVVDAVSSARANDYSLVWHFDSRWHAVVGQDHLEGEADNVRFRFLSLDTSSRLRLIENGETDPIQGFRSPRWNETEACPTLVQTAASATRASFASALGFSADGFDVTPVAGSPSAYRIVVAGDEHLLDLSAVPASLTRIGKAGAARVPDRAGSLPVLGPAHLRRSVPSIVKELASDVYASVEASAAMESVRAIGVAASLRQVADYTKEHRLLRFGRFRQQSGQGPRAHE